MRTCASATSSNATSFTPSSNHLSGSTAGTSPAQAFTRGPAGHDLEQPDRLFAAAHACGYVREFDMHCLRSALAREWNVVVVGPHYAAALLARDLGDVDVPDAERRFQFVVTHRRDVVLNAARSLFARLCV